MASARDELKRCASMLAQGPAFQDWKAFMEAYRAFTGEIRNDMVNAPIDVLQQAQGRAQGLTHLQSIFEEATKRK